MSRSIMLLKWSIEMSVGKYDLKIFQGGDFNFPLTIRDNGVIRDLTGWSARAMMRKKSSDASPTATFECTIPSPTDGTVYMKLSHTVTELLDPAVYRYDLELYTANDAEVVKLMRGRAVVVEEYTK